MKMVTSGQKKLAVDTICVATSKSVKTVIGELSKAGVVHAGNFQRILSQGDKLALAIGDFAKAKLIELAEHKVGPLKQIFLDKEITISETDGKTNIPSAKSVFTSAIDSNFKNFGLDIPSKPTGKTKVEMFELVEDSNFNGMFGAFGQNLYRLCFEESQVVKFAEEHPDLFREDDCGTVFLIKKERQPNDPPDKKKEFFVADVYRDSGGLSVNVDRLSYGFVWSAGHGDQIVVPQL